MSDFTMPTFTKETTIGEKYGPAMQIEDQALADAYFEACVLHTLSFGEVNRKRAEELERANLGYFAGYYSAETRARIERVFRCMHPIFGPIAIVGQPTAEEAFEAGKRIAGVASEEKG